VRPTAGPAPGELPAALAGERRRLAGRSGPLACYVAGEGAPLLLLHSINAAASAYEVRPIHEHFRPRSRVFAPDLPGFGASDRSDRRYDVRLYVDAVHDALDAIERDVGPAPVDALALSLASEFLARAATERPERFRSLALVTPTGFRAGSERLRGPAGGTREVPLLHAVLTARPWRRALYAGLTQPASIRYFLRRTFGSDRVDPGLVEYAVRTARAAGAEHAPFAFLCARLFSSDVRSVYEAVLAPVWLAHGTRGDFSDFRDADWARASRQWTVQGYDTGALPHFERPEPFFRDYERFLASVDGAGAGRC